MAVTWQNIKDLFYETIGDSSTYPTFFDNATVASFADESMREASNRTRYADYYEQQPSISGTAPVVVSQGVTYVQVWRVEFDGEKLIPITTEEVRRSDRFWSTRTGTPRFYMLDEYQTDTAAPTIRLYETPSVDDLLVEVYGWGVQSAINDSSPTQTVNVPEWFAYNLLFGMLAKAYEADTEMQAFDKSQFYGMLWEDAIMRLRVRSFGRLNKKWAYKGANYSKGPSIRNRLPEHITEP